MKNSLKFDYFLQNLQKTNANLSYFVDFDKCDKNVQEVSIYLHALNFLLGESDLKSAINLLFEMNKNCFCVLNLLIVARYKNAILVGENLNLAVLKDYFCDAEKIYDFFVQIGLKEIFQSGKISNLHDYVFGIEVGLDTNARKNRGGKIMEKIIADKFRASRVEFGQQVETKNLGINLGDDVKRFDFVIKTKRARYLIESNFYNVGGSKLNEVARAYIEISEKISRFDGFKFVWITDG